MFALDGVSVAGISVGTCVSETVVGGSDVCVMDATVGVEGGDVDVFDPLHAAANNASKRINRLICYIIFRLYQ